ncbi:MAG TPA: nitroreductase family deazaflavin-dependent oxidoreductase [Candidatus Limnocylindria bacterium]|nr:nitroreductase family deazaflavin-dependent oxidoreductase [Candidatus Limnocylindria bacterium]
MASQPPLRFIRPFTTRLVNPITRRFADRLPGFGIISYRGRKSGKRYDTPMNVFHVDDDWIFALTYGSDVQWVKNVLASGQADLETRGRTIHLTEPEVFVDPSRHLMPGPVRFFLGLLGVSEFMRMRPTSAGAGG